jgi:polygalacturonase
MSGLYDVRAYGARGDGRAPDTKAVNSAIVAANRDGGGTVDFPAGVYLCHSIHLLSNVTLYIGQGATIMAAPPAALGSDAETYDLPEPLPYHPYQDFGHSHWHNSLIWGENLQNIAIVGPGMIDGSKGLVRAIPKDRKQMKLGDGLWEPAKPTTGPTTTPTTKDADAEPTSRPVRHHPPATQSSTQSTTKATTKPMNKPDIGEVDHAGDGLGNKSIALKLCRNVILRDFTVRCGGHFAILATGVDNCTVDNLKLDTNRDGIDLDCCRNVVMSNCFVNTASDDGICPKSSYALGYARPCENITITNCQVSGFVTGTFLDGTLRLPKDKHGKEYDGTGRIKCGTESNGAFRNITISNCTFDHCRGLALESVDGARLEDISITNITMRHMANAPIFLRLGARLRGPKGLTTVGTLQRINISNIVVYDASRTTCSIITGIPDFPIKDVKLSNIQIFAHGDGRDFWATTRPAENPGKYPEPDMFGPTPAYGFFIRHVQGIELNNVAVHFDEDEPRPPFVLQDVRDVKLMDVDAQTPDGVAPFTLRQVTNLRASQCQDIPDTTQPSVDEGQLGPGTVPPEDGPDEVDEEAPATNRW